MGGPGESSRMNHGLATPRTTWGANGWAIFAPTVVPRRTSITFALTRPRVPGWAHGLSLGTAHTDEGMPAPAGSGPRRLNRAG